MSKVNYSDPGSSLTKDASASTMTPRVVTTGDHSLCISRQCWHFSPHSVREPEIRGGGGDERDRRGRGQPYTDADGLPQQRGLNYRRQVAQPISPAKQ